MVLITFSVDKMIKVDFTLSPKKAWSMGRGEKRNGGMERTIRFFF